MNRRALQWAAGCAGLGLLLLALGIHAAVTFRAPRSNGGQVLTLGQLVDIVIAVGLLAVAALIIVGQVRTRRRLTRHRRWIEKHNVD